MKTVIVDRGWGVPQDILFIWNKHILAFAGGLAIHESKTTTTKLIRTAAWSSALL